MSIDPSLFRLDGRVALVTGAGQGIGRIIATGLGTFGARVAVLDRDPARAAEAAAGIESNGTRSLPLVADVTSREQVEAAFAECKRALGPVDVLVNNAGVWSITPALELTLEEWNRTLAVNLTGVLLCSNAAARQMIESGLRGSIVNIASISSQIALKGRAAYVTSKHGLVGLTKVLANEWAQHGIRVNAIGPGVHTTPMTSEWRSDPAVQAELLAKIPMRRLADPAELVGPAVFLASEASSYVTGQTIYSDGGWLLE